METDIRRPVLDSDHSTLCSQLNFKVQPCKAFTRKIWLYNQADIEGLNNFIRSLDWDTCFQSSDINVIWQSWKKNYFQALNLSIPNKICQIRPNDKPWYTSALRTLRRKLDRLYKKAKQTKKLADHAKFTSARVLYFNECKQAKAEYLTNLENKINNPNFIGNRSWWSTVKPFITNKNKEISHIVENNQVISDENEIATSLNNFFLASASLNNEPDEIPDNNIVYNDSSLDSITVNEQDVADVIKTLKTNKASGPDGISPKMLSLCSSALVKPLTRLFNASLKLGKVPDEWKMANIVPIHKKGSTTEVKNYRPISLISCVGKVMEKIVFKYMYNFITSYNLLTNLQSGFRPGDSTNLQLIDLYHIFSEALDKHKELRIVFCDFSKAFDTVWHEGILYKLNMLGFRGHLHQWLTSYLMNRNQRVIIRNGNSVWGKVKAGVPQGSVLGPLFFLIYINDLASEINCGIRLFADDTCLYVSTEEPNLAADILTSNLEKLWDWSIKWHLNFNPAKTECMLFSWKRNALNHPDIKFGNENINNVKNHKHLGLTFTHDLTWNNHIDDIIVKATSKLNILKKLKYKLSRKALEILYFAFIRPQLEYSSTVFINCTKQQTDNLEKVQLDAARIITGAIKGTRHNFLYRETKWDTLKPRLGIGSV